jgi:hypothetical protein
MLPFESPGTRGAHRQCGDRGENSRRKVQNVVTDSSAENPWWHTGVGSAYEDLDIDVEDFDLFFA